MPPARSLCGQSLLDLFSGKRPYREDSEPIELLVGYERYSLEEVLNAFLKFSDLRHLYSEIPYLAVKCDRKDARALLEDSPAIASVTALDLSHEVRTFAAPARFEGETSSSLWNLDRIGAPVAQQRSQGEGVAIAVIDTGIDYSHPDLSGRFGDLLGYNVANPGLPPLDDNGHGTHVSGIVAGAQTGVAPGATLYAVKVLDGAGSGSEADVIAGIEWAMERGADLANLSLGSRSASRAFEAVCAKARQKGMLIVAAAGNEGYGPSYPAAFGESVVAVAATDRGDAHPEFSNIYPTNDIAAPGVGIYSTFPGGYNTLTGTSMAAPHVTGSLALALSHYQNGGMDLEQLMKDRADRLTEGGGGGGEGDDGDSEAVFGAGLVRPDRMVGAEEERKDTRRNRRKLRDILSRGRRRPF